MRKLLNLIPDIFDIQWSPRFKGWPFYFSERWDDERTYGMFFQIGQYRVYFEYMK
jgi:hypothetical protein